MVATTRKEKSMPKTGKQKRSRRQVRNLGEIAPEAVIITRNDTGESKFIRLGRLDGYNFRFVWEFDVNGNNEFLEADITDMQLFKFASERGLLVETVSSERRVPVPVHAVARRHRLPAAAEA